jgi:hypothetical protein
VRRRLTSEVGCLPEVFANVNKNFISTVNEGVLEMAGGAGSVDLGRMCTSSDCSVIKCNLQNLTICNFMNFAFNVRRLCNWTGLRGLRSRITILRILCLKVL